MATLRWSKPPHEMGAQSVLHGSATLSNSVTVRRTRSDGYYWVCASNEPFDCIDTVGTPVATAERAQRWAESYVRNRLRLKENKHHVAELLVEIRNGVHVHVLEDTGKVTSTTTRSDPWQLGDGSWVVLLVGRTGGYQLTRCALAMPPHAGRE